MTDIERLQSLLETRPFQFASTMHTNPHWYTLRKNWSADEFAWAVQAIRNLGTPENFKGWPYTVLRIGDYKYWSMGAPVHETTLINRKWIALDELGTVARSIEYCHIYTSQQFSTENAASVVALQNILAGVASHQLVVMVDDYSPDVPDNFNYAGFLARLAQKGALPAVLVRESELVPDNVLVVDSLKDMKLQKQLRKYIEDHGKHPCSLFIATFYLMRLGVIPNRFGIQPAMRLTNILPRRFEEQEDKARKIIEGLAGKPILDRIENIYLDSDATDEGGLWNSFDPETYIFENFLRILPVDLYVLATLMRLYSKRPPTDTLLEVGAGPYLAPILVALPYFSKITVAEPGAQNIAYLKAQQTQIDAAWLPFIQTVRALDPALADFDFQAALASKVTVTDGSIYDLQPETCDVASMHCVAESITASHALFISACVRFAESVKPGGLFAASFMEGSNGYTVNGVQFPACPVAVGDVADAFRGYDVTVERLAVSVAPIRKGYDGTILAVGRK